MDRTATPSRMAEREQVFERSRLSGEALAWAYERLVPVVRPLARLPQEPTPIRRAARQPRPARRATS